MPGTGTGSIATGGLFTDAIIPLTHPAVSQTGLNILKTVADRDDQRPMAQNEDGNTNANGTAFIVDGDDVHLQGRAQVQRQVVAERPLHLQQDRRAGQHDHEGRQAVHGRSGSVVRAAARRPHVLVCNSTNVINDTTVLSLRYGWHDLAGLVRPQPFSPGSSRSVSARPT
jgi:hypothetical protein